MSYSVKKIYEHEPSKERISEEFMKEIWINSRKNLFEGWLQELREELVEADNNDKEYLEALIFRIENMQKRKIK